VYAWNEETFGERGTLGRADTREVVLTRDLRAAIVRLNPALPASAVDEAVQRLTRHDFSRSLCAAQPGVSTASSRDGVPVDYRDERGQVRKSHARGDRFPQSRRKPLFGGARG